jgi:hypothetical protein
MVRVCVHPCTLACVRPERGEKKGEGGLRTTLTTQKMQAKACIAPERIMACRAA